MQHRARFLDLPAELQINFTKRRIKADQAGTSGVHGDQREFHARTAPVDCSEHWAGAAKRTADVWIFELAPLVWRNGRGGRRVRGRTGRGNAGDDAECGIRSGSFVGREERGLPDLEQDCADDEYHAVGGGRQAWIVDDGVDGGIFDWGRRLRL